MEDYDSEKEGKLFEKIENTLKKNGLPTDVCYFHWIVNENEMDFVMYKSIHDYVISRFLEIDENNYLPIDEEDNLKIIMNNERIKIFIDCYMEKYLDIYLKIRGDLIKLLWGEENGKTNISI